MRTISFLGGVLAGVALFTGFITGGTDLIVGIVLAVIIYFVLMFLTSKCKKTKKYF